MKTKLTRKQKIILALLALLLLGGVLLWWWLRGDHVGAITYQKLSGPHTGYQLQIELEQPTINPTAGWQTKGKVIVQDKDGNPVTSAQGGVLLYTGQTPSADADGDGYNLFPGYLPLLTTSGEYYNPKFLVGNNLLEYSEKDLVAMGVGGGQTGNWQQSEDGFDFIETDSSQVDGARGMSPRYFVLENGQAEFGLLSRGNEIGQDRLLLTASTIEQQTTTSYQLVPPAGVSRDKNQIRTIATIPVDGAASNRWIKPVVYHQSADDYYYDIRVRKYGFWVFSWVPKPVQLTITPRALPGHRLPANIDDTITLKLQKAYPLNKTQFAFKFADSNQKSLGGRFVKFNSTVGSATSRSQDELIIKMDRQPARVTLDATSLPTQLGAQQVLLIAKKNVSLNDSYAQNCQKARISVSESQSTGNQPEAFPLECLPAFAYTVTGWKAPIR